MSDPRRIVDWGGADLIITPPPAGAGPQVVGVVYERNRVIAYLDDQGKPTTPEQATFARVWDKDGLHTVRLEPE